jgi:long-chain fatty acid transport protein
LSLLILLGLATPSRANIDQFGFGARAISLGGAFTGQATDYSAVYYNPAGLAFTKGVSNAYGFSYAGYEMDFSADDLGSDAEGKVERLQPLSAITVGLAAKLGSEGIRGHFSAGVGVFLPTRQVLAIQTEASPGDPTYFFYGKRRDKFAIMPAAAFRILPWDEGDEGPRLSLGLGATILADMDGEIIFNLDPNTTTPARTDFGLQSDVAPNVGIFYWPLDWLSFGIAYRGELSLKVDLDIVLDLDGDGISDFPLAFEAVTLFQPHQVQAGVAVDPSDAITLSFDVTWYNWAGFDDPFITIEPILAQTDPDMDNTFVPRVGAEFRVHDAVTLRTGYYYQPSPVPEQAGATNLVDPDKHVFSLGGGYTFWTTRDEYYRKGDEVLARSIEWDAFSVDLFAQFHFLTETSSTKDDPAAAGGLPNGFDASGFIWNLGIFTTFRF